MPAKSSAGPSSKPSSPIRQIQSLESTLLADLSDPNPLLPILVYARHDSPEVVHKAIWALHRCFVPLISANKVGALISTDIHSKRDGEEEGEGGSTERQVKSWVRGRLVEYVEILGGLIRDKEPALRTSALPLLFSLLPPLSTQSPSGLHTIYFRIILNTLMNPGASLRGASPAPANAARKWNIVPANQVEEDQGVLPGDVAQMAVDDFWAKYDDLRLIFFREAKNLLDTTSSPLPQPSNLLNQLLPLTNLPRKQADLNAFYIPTLSTPPPSSAKQPKSSKSQQPKSIKSKSKSAKEAETTPAWMEAYDSDSSDSSPSSVPRDRERTSKLSLLSAIHSVGAHTTAYTELWLSVLSRVELAGGWTRKILVGLHGQSGILSYMRPDKRVRVADWLGSLVDRGGVEGMLAVNGLFVLMTQYNLDYPNFYPRLYSLLTPSLLHTRYKARFFRLLDTFLRSSLLPSALIASFVKRLSRLALIGPPGGVVLVLPFVYGLIKRHVGCMGMLQRYSEGEWEDPYDPLDPSPFTSRAIDSSLWELASLHNHYLASVSTLSGIFREAFTKPEFGLEDFMDHGYATMFDTEVQRKIKNPPALSLALELEDKGQARALFPSASRGTKRKAEILDGEVGEEDTGLGSMGDVVVQLWAF